MHPHPKTSQYFFENAVIFTNFVWLLSIIINSYSAGVICLKSLNLNFLSYIFFNFSKNVKFQESSSINDCIIGLGTKKNTSITSNISLSDYIVQSHKCATTEFGQYMSTSSANSSFLSQSLFEEANKKYDVSTLIMG